MSEPEEKPVTPTPTHRKFPVPSARALRWLQLLVVALVVALGTYLIVQVGNLGTRTSDQGDTIRTLIDSNAAQDEALREANRQLIEAGQTPVQVPDPPDDTEPVEISSAQIQAAIDRYCSGGGCTPVPSSAQVLDAIDHFCSSNGECIGPKGDLGDQGPPPTTIQLIGAFSAYCGDHNGCRGPQGESGTDGQDGQNGDEGPQGAQGDQGPKGDQGDQGPKGDDGPKGNDGEAGPQGPPGTATPGSYGCPDGQYVTGFTVASTGDVNVACGAPLLP